VYLSGAHDKNSPAADGIFFKIYYMFSFSLFQEKNKIIFMPVKRLLHIGLFQQRSDIPDIEAAAECWLGKRCFDLSDWYLIHASV
jgi:hypothetical protein